MKMPTLRKSERGMALVTVLLLLAVVSSLLAAHFVLSRVEMETTRTSMQGTRAFYGAESGLNIRAEQIRQEFIGYNRPSGTSPTTPAGDIPCAGTGTAGAGDFECQTLVLENHDVLSYVEEPPGNPQMLTIPPGELYQNLNAQEYVYEISSVAKQGTRPFPEAILQMQFRSRLVPLFQFAAFYDKDLEILPGPDMTLDGPVHSNGDLYLGANATLTINGQVTTAGDLYHGRKNDDVCQAGGVAVYDPANPTGLPACGPGRLEVTNVTPWNGMIHLGVDEVTVPPPEELDPVTGSA